MLRNFRYLAASLFAVAATLSAPSRSSADVQVLIQEIGPGGATTTLLNTTVASNGQVNTSSANYSSINLQFGNSVNNFAASFSTGYTITPSTSLDPSNAPQLSITVRDMGPTGNGIPALAGATADLTNLVSVTNGILTNQGFGTHSLTATTSLVEFDNISSVIASSGPDTATATVIGAGNGSITQGIDNISEAYAIVQSFTISVGGTGTPLASTVTGGVSSTLVATNAAVPAPPAILLAAMAVPAFGLRRILRRKKA